MFEIHLKNMLRASTQFRMPCHIKKCFADARYSYRSALDGNWFNKFRLLNYIQTLTLKKKSALWKSWQKILKILRATKLVYKLRLIPIFPLTSRARSIAQNLRNSVSHPIPFHGT
ncbi:hypothetical protein D9M68_695560 [compost metagenome]